MSGVQLVEQQLQAELAGREALASQGMQLAAALSLAESHEAQLRTALAAAAAAEADLAQALARAAATGSGACVTGRPTTR